MKTSLQRRPAGGSSPFTPSRVLAAALVVAALVATAAAQPAPAAAPPAPAAGATVVQIGRASL
jgi:hypothetical protein